MKTKNLRYLPLVLLALAGCKPEKDDVFYLDPMPVFEAKKSSPLASDSINALRPSIGAANVEREFPFGTANKPVELRLLEVTEKFNDPNVRYENKTTYEYGTSGKLVKKTYQTNTGIIWDINTYDSGTSDRVQVTTEVNKGVVYVQGYYRRNGKTQYEPTNETKSWVLKSYNRDDQYNGDNSPTLRTRLGFDSKGQLVWEEGIYLNAASSGITSYKLYKRDANGNATFTRFVTGTPITEEKINYDDKPNPYRTTGDILLPEATNPNNILTQQITETSVTGKYITTYRYEYEYRPDGYPRLSKTYKDEKLSSIREFKYNQ